MLLHQSIDTIGGVQQIADGLIMVQVFDQICNVLAHIDLNVPRSCAKLCGTVNQVGGEDLLNQALVNSLVEELQSGCEQTESSD